jgi:hypothetical protein
MLALIALASIEEIHRVVRVHGHASVAVYLAADSSEAQPVGKAGTQAVASSGGSEELNLLRR